MTRLFRRFLCLGSHPDDTETETKQILKEKRVHFAPAPTRHKEIPRWEKYDGGETKKKTKSCLKCKITLKYDLDLYKAHEMTVHPQSFHLITFHCKEFDEAQHLEEGDAILEELVSNINTKIRCKTHGTKRELVM
jgi:hypothetical protein